ncbi:thiaminase II [Brachybacterium endophyticum]|uniref:Aminopyrimidine aminohydrolase n=1 Tax=Brachybacterium endophyticum TaxID=2182385 RepID=A0A2U2RNK6_9MICO|nr:thiaminase II [Brachybacterium endophyticum]PWH07375.1 thiaminase II [Brachybacterium endophyticum]
MSLFTRLREAASEDWEAYTRHDFVTRLGEGTLPLPAFQDYLVQDYLFLVQFARANALAAFKSRSLHDIGRAAESLNSILEETALHVGLTESWGISPEELESTPEKQATVAYTRYVLDCGMAGDLLDLEVALTPCTLGYAEIGTALAPSLEAAPDHPYATWIAEYAGEDYQAAARSSHAHLDELAGGELSPARFAQLVTVFRTATRMETAFWQQALDGARVEA